MEELAATDNIKQEILADARGRAEQLLGQAEQRVCQIRAESSRRRVVAEEELRAAEETRTGHERAERLARLPLERARLRLAFLDGALHAALDRFVGNLQEERVAELARRLLSGSGSLLEGRSVRLRLRGLSSELALATLTAVCGRAILACPPLEDPGLVADGLVVETEDGRLVLRATMDLVKEGLADRHRGELARALCGKAADP